MAAARVLGDSHEPMLLEDRFAGFLKQFRPSEDGSIPNVAVLACIAHLRES
jgi:hypothetical protein